MVKFAVLTTSAAANSCTPYFPARDIPKMLPQARSKLNITDSLARVSIDLFQAGSAKFAA